MDSVFLILTVLALAAIGTVLILGGDFYES